MREMKLLLKRFYDDGKGTLGILFVDGKFECFTLEDTFRETKIPSETRIPSGKYWIDYRLGSSPKNERYQKNYPWFKWHLHIKDVPNFQYVYIHIGNTVRDTDGCVLVGLQADKVGNSPSGSPQILQSKKAFKTLYEKVSKALDHGYGVQIEIQDTL